MDTKSFKPRTDTNREYTFYIEYTDHTFDRFDDVLQADTIDIFVIVEQGDGNITFIPKQSIRKMHQIPKKV